MKAPIATAHGRRANASQWGMGGVRFRATCVTLAQEGTDFESSEKRLLAEPEFTVGIAPTKGQKT